MRVQHRKVSALPSSLPLHRAVPAIAAAVGLLFLAPLASGAQMEPSAPSPAPSTTVPSILVQGEGRMESDPDEAVVRVGVEAQAETAQEAQDRVNRVASAILEGVTALGIEARAVQTSRLSLYPVYEQPRPMPQRSGSSGEPELVGYRASNVVTVTVSDLAKVGPVVDAAIEAGANRIEGVSFQLRNDMPVRQEALRKAVASAEAKATAIAEALGRSLGEVLEVEEGGVSMERPPMVRQMMAMESMAAADTPVSAGQVEVSASVTVRYRLNP